MPRGDPIENDFRTSQSFLFSLLLRNLVTGSLLINGLMIKGEIPVAIQIVRHETKISVRFGRLRNVISSWKLPVMFCKLFVVGIIPNEVLDCIQCLKQNGLKLLLYSYYLLKISLIFI